MTLQLSRMQPITIKERFEYDYIVSRGYEPLLDWKRFKMDIRLRKQIQRELFGKGHTPQENEKFYKWVWAHKPHRCEETLRPLRSYSSVYISHILTRGAFPEMAHDPRNCNVLSYEMHERWENHDRQNMRIYKENCKVIELLKSEYNENKGF